MRVLHVIDSLIQAGAEAMVKDMVPRMRSAGVEVCVAVLNELDSPFERELRELNITFLPTAGGGIYSPTHVLSLRRHIHKFDVIQVYLFPAQLFAALAVVLAGSKVPLVLSEQTTYHRRRKMWLRPLEKWMYSRYTAIACASEAIAASLKDWVPGVSDKISVIPNGIDIQTFERAYACATFVCGNKQWQLCIALCGKPAAAKRPHQPAPRYGAHLRCRSRTGRRRRIARTT